MAHDVFSLSSESKERILSNVDNHINDIVSPVTGGRVNLQKFSANKKIDPKFSMDLSENGIMKISRAFGSLLVFKESIHSINYPFTKKWKTAWENLLNSSESTIEKISGTWDNKTKEVYERLADDIFTWQDMIFEVPEQKRKVLLQFVKEFLSGNVMEIDNTKDDNLEKLIELYNNSKDKDEFIRMSYGISNKIGVK